MISINISPTFIPNDPISNISALVQMMTCRRSDEKPLFEPMMAWFIEAYMRHPAVYVVTRCSGNGDQIDIEIVSVSAIRIASQ